MQHKLNCIGCLHTPISPVSHGHRAALSGARSAAGGTCVGACVRACVGGKRRVWHAYRAFVCGKNWHWAREGYPSFATRIDTPTGITAKNTTPPPPLSPSVPRSRARFLLSPAFPFPRRIIARSGAWQRRPREEISRLERIVALGQMSFTIVECALTLSWWKCIRSQTRTRVLSASAWVRHSANVPRSYCKTYLAACVRTCICI